MVWNSRRCLVPFAVRVTSHIRPDNTDVSRSGDRQSAPCVCPWPPSDVRASPMNVYQGVEGRRACVDGRGEATRDGAVRNLGVLGKGAKARLVTLTAFASRRSGDARQRWRPPWKHGGAVAGERSICICIPPRWRPAANGLTHVRPSACTVRLGLPDGGGALSDEPGRRRAVACPRQRAMFVFLLRLVPFPSCPGMRAAGGLWVGRGRGATGPDGG